MEQFCHTFSLTDALPIGLSVDDPQAQPVRGREVGAGQRGITRPRGPSGLPKLRRSALGRDRFTSKASRPSALLHRSEENTSELQSLMSITYYVICLKTKKISETTHN